ncbi:MAG: hypothetical protein ACM3VS_16525 [Candidatus Dadabacteria bacterium]
MKKYLFLPTLFAAALLSFQFTASAQKSFKAPKTFNLDLTKSVSASKMKIETVVSKSELNLRLLKRFTKQFKTIKDESWIKTESGFVVHFNENAIPNTAYLNNHGFCEGLIRYYSEKQLPEDVRTRVKSSYFDYNIIGVTEVNVYTTPEKNITAYLVTIDSPTRRKIIRVVDGDMDEYQAFTKAPAHG